MRRPWTMSWQPGARKNDAKGPWGFKRWGWPAARLDRVLAGRRRRLCLGHRVELRQLRRRGGGSARPVPGVRRDAVRRGRVVPGGLRGARDRRRQRLRDRLGCHDRRSRARCAGAVPGVQRRLPDRGRAVFAVGGGWRSRADGQRRHGCEPRACRHCRWFLRRVACYFHLHLGPKRGYEQEERAGRGRRGALPRERRRVMRRQLAPAGPTTRSTPFFCSPALSAKRSACSRRKQGSAGVRRTRRPVRIRPAAGGLRTW